MVQAHIQKFFDFVENPGKILGMLGAQKFFGQV